MARSRLGLEAAGPNPIEKYAIVAD